ncbi:GNAT family N-acetyltransferase [Petrocella sp. FN5]|uniref:GNAT family N-acetyltransferase n=1 Tax=Petrocella sp. FN5 TaxID=3032002 RepID=UPI002ED39EA3
MEYVIRKIHSDETGRLEDFLYEAIFQKSNRHPLPRKVIYDPSLKIFFENFGRKDDHCLMAEVEGKVVGAVWTRVFPEKDQGFAKMEATPELAISLYKPYRKKGLGKALMEQMLQLLDSLGYEKVALSVQKENPAIKLYEKLGFEIVKELDEEYLMVYYFEANTYESASIEDVDLDFIKAMEADLEKTSLSKEERKI